MLFLMLTNVNTLFVHNRIKNWIDSQGLRPSSFADKIGVNRATISHILLARNKPSIDFINKMIKVFPDLNSNWLISGEGFMYKSKELKEVTKTKGIVKIVVFYDDNSFDELKS